MNYLDTIAENISKIVNIDSAELIKMIEIPPNKSMGDYAFPCFKLSKSLRQAPNIIADNLAKELSLASIQNGSLDILDEFVEEQDDIIIIVNSSEGGSGSGASAIIAKYVKEVLGKNVLCFVFTGFEEDGRGLQNTIEYFQDMQEEYIVQAISNKKFLEGTNKFRAEKAANDEFVERIKVLLGQGLIDSEQNIDETDLYKVSTTPAFMTINKALLGKIKNVSQFNSVLTDMIDNDKSLDVSEKSAKRLAVFLNITEQTRDYIDYSFSVIKDKLGIPYEVFTHVQWDETEEYVAFICSGMKMPIDEVKNVYEKYKIESQKVNKQKDNFFNITSELKGNADDDMFNVTGRAAVIKKDKSAFFSSFGNAAQNKTEVQPEQKDKGGNITIGKKEFIENSVKDAKIKQY
jgi:cell division GTPase FtsZ